MLSLAQGAYTSQQVRDILHARTGSREVRFRYALLNKYDVEIGTLSSVMEGSVSQDSLAEITRTARFEMAENEALDINWLTDRIKPYMQIRMPDGAWIEWPLGVFLISSPSRYDGAGSVTRSIEAYDKNLILQEDCFTNRYLIAAGTTYTDAITTIIETAGIWKHNITSSTAALEVAKEFEIGTTKLSAVNELLTELNYSPLYVDANGYTVGAPYVIPTLRETDYSYETDEVSIIEPGATHEEDLFGVPNLWVVTATNPEKSALVSTYTNIRATSPTSTINRGRTIVDYRLISDVFDQTTLDAYVLRLAYEASQIYGRFIFNTALMPHHGHNDMLFINHDGLSVDTKYTEISWDMELKSGGTMRHECRRVIKI